MNKQRNTLLIILIIVLVFFLLVGRSCSCHRNIEREALTVEDVLKKQAEAMENHAELMDEAMKNQEEAFENIDANAERMDSSYNHLGENLDTLGQSLDKAVCSDSIVYGGYLKTSFPYPIVFHFENPFEMGDRLVRNVAVYPRHLIGKIPTNQLDLNNSVQVSLASSQTSHTTLQLFSSIKTKYSQRIFYTFKYLGKKGAYQQVVADSGTFMVSSQQERSGFSFEEMRVNHMDKQTRLILESQIIKKIREKYKK